jgi:hypothetical protein
MPIIYLKHPVHGTKVANMELEANADVANGWKVYNPNEQHTAPVEKVLIQLVDDAEVVEQPVEVKRRRRT